MSANSAKNPPCPRLNQRAFCFRLLQSHGGKAGEPKAKSVSAGYPSNLPRSGGWVHCGDVASASAVLRRRSFHDRFALAAYMAGVVADFCPRP
jgi:hypothetical protein